MGLGKQNDTTTRNTSGFSGRPLVSNLEEHSLSLWEENLVVVWFMFWCIESTIWTYNHQQYTNINKNKQKTHIFH